MYYAIMGRDVPDSLAKRKAVRAEHLARIQTLVDEGRVLVAGPHPALDSDDPGDAGFTGSLIIAEFDSLQSAKEWADGDPYSAAGVFQDVEIKPFKVVLP